MAGIDHTIIPFHNGRLMRDMFRVTNDEFISLIPFEYTRDGEITGVRFDRVIEIPQYYSNTKLGDWIIRKIGTRMDKNYVCHYQKDALAILVYKSANYNVTFYMDGDESYVLLGGYGHWQCPYTHFYHRGYGEAFERQMAKECYQWLCEKVLQVLAPYVEDDTEEAYSQLCNRLRFKRYWDMNDDERKDYLSNNMMDYDTDEDVRAEGKMTDDEKIDVVAREVLERHRAAFEELSK